MVLIAEPFAAGSSGMMFRNGVAFDVSDTRGDFTCRILERIESVRENICIG
jgi:hypothetical protein